MRNRDKKEIESPAAANPLLRLHLNSKDASSTEASYVYAHKFFANVTL